MQQSAIDSYNFIYTRATEQRQGDIEILMNNKHTPYIKNIDIISERIMAIKLNYKPAITIISCYAQTNTYKKEDYISYINDMQKYMNNLPEHDIKIILGYFNVRIGKGKIKDANIGKFTAEEKTDRNGKLLIKFINGCNMKCASFLKPHKNGIKWTQKHLKGNTSQIGYILINNKWANSITDCRSFNSLNIDSDHRPSEQWITSTIIPIHKKGNIKDPNNFRGISLTSIAAKIYSKIILERLKHHIENLLRPNHAGFRNNKSCNM